MINPQRGPIVLEYNCRWGDPETQVLLPLLQGSLCEIFLSVAEGQLPNWELIPNRYACCVVLASPGYPENPKLGLEIEGPIEELIAQGRLLVCGAQKSQGQWRNSGGRVFNAMGFGSSPEEARRQAYTVADSICFEGQQVRRDIGQGASP
jgi:phosphoribosylamine--glycine ligase